MAELALPLVKQMSDCASKRGSGSNQNASARGMCWGSLLSERRLFPVLISISVVVPIPVLIVLLVMLMMFVVFVALVLAPFVSPSRHR
jgi:hypothetical protein